ncbi:MAG TPA: GrpB family protein [Chloroflexota bacterium]
MTNPVILPYHVLPAGYHAWDPRAPEVAHLVADLIEREAPSLTVEHVGSTAVPGCGGKGIVDLMLMYPPATIPEARDTLERLGFQHQVTRSPFPEERPMRTGAILHDDTEFRIHVHVISADSPEVEEFRTFRDSLRGDPELLARYEARKQEIIASGITDGTDYSMSKGSFCREVLTQHGLEVTHPA